MTKNKYQTLMGIVATLWLAACAVKPPPEYRSLKCPPVPPCRQSSAEIRTNADLAAALLDTRAALAVCAISRDTLQACLDNQGVLDD